MGLDLFPRSRFKSNTLLPGYFSIVLFWRLLRFKSIQYLAVLLLFTCFGIAVSGCSDDSNRNTEVRYDQDRLIELRDEIEIGSFGDIHSLLIELDNEVIEASYFNGYTSDDLHPLHSVSKSITSALVGIAIDQGEIVDIDEAVIPYFEDTYDSIDNSDPRKTLLSIRNLLTMQTGLQWDSGRSSADQTYDNSTEALIQSDDWIKFVLDLPLDDTPGSSLRYCNGATTLLSGIVENATGHTSEMYASINLFAPLDIDDWQWDSGPDGVTATAWGLHLRAADMLKIGRLYLAGGNWNGMKLISSEWIQASTGVQATAGAFDYGFNWWRFGKSHDVARVLPLNDAFFARGRGGQYILVSPHLRLIVVSTADNVGDADSFFDALIDYILPAVSVSG